ncbi:MAG: polysaccharide pyruvyl transferase family protein [Rhodothermales bacterium]|nr:polysaccharide pyruvyl transferase family protein [Rhodothermales bacterium]
MIIEVTGTNTWNKGAELMLVAIRERFLARYPDYTIAVDGSFGSYADRANYQLKQKVNRGRWGKTRLALTLLSRSFRDAYGLAFDEDIDAVLDASGFAFGDQHPTRRIVEFADQVDIWRRYGCPVILLPQALGPFDNPVQRECFRRIASSASHIFARDTVSFQHACGAAESDENITMAPDFTNLVTPPSSVKLPGDRMACIVPNQRMIEKAGSDEAADAYEPLLEHAILALQGRGMECFLLVHGVHDETLASALRDRVGGIRIVRESDPVRIKAILGAVDVVVASRFHALVSALSQGVPAIATSWSHKYEQLFSDYACENLVLPVPCPPDRVQEAVDHVAGAARQDLIETIRSRGSILKEQSRTMWNEVETIIGLAGPAGG